MINNITNHMQYNNITRVRLYGREKGGDDGRQDENVFDLEIVSCASKWVAVYPRPNHDKFVR